MQWLELRVPPLLVWLGVAGLMAGVAYAAPGLAFTLAGRGTIALALAALGAGVALAGVIAFRAQGTTVNPLSPGASSALVSTGVYRFSRNPMYLGFLLALAGWAVYLGNAGAALLLPGFVAYLTRFQIEPEERALRERFGAEFVRYVSSVRRWV